MAGYEHTIIVGNVGKLDGLKYTKSGVAINSFSVAVNRSYKDSNGEKRESTNWYRVSCWRALAEITNEYVHKGMQIMVTGRVEASAFVGQDGEARASLDLTAQDVQFLGRRGDGEQQSGAAQEREDAPF